MEPIEDFSDERLKAWCIHCGAGVNETISNRDHAPSKSLLNRPLPPHVPQVFICKACNSGFSLDEEYFVALMSCILTGSTDPTLQVNEAVGRAFVRNPRLRELMDRARTTQFCLDGSEETNWQPDMPRIQKVILKNARGHAFYEFGEPMRDEPEHIVAIPISIMNDEQRNAFKDVGSNVWPEVGSRMMTRLVEGQDIRNGWVVVQDGVYRYAVFQQAGLVVRSVIREYLATEVIWA